MRGLLLSAGLVVLLEAPFAAAQDAPPPVEAAAPTLALTVAAPDGCTDASGMRRDVERFLGRPLGEVTETPSWRVEASVQPRDARFEVTVRFTHEGEAWTRELDDPDCALLAEAAAFVIATAIDPVAVAETGETPGTVTPESSADAAEPIADSPDLVGETPTETTTDDPGRPEARSATQEPAASASDEGGGSLPIGVAVHAHAVGAFDAVPGPALGVDAGVALRIGRRGRVGASFRFLGATRASSSVDPDAGVSVGLVYGALSGCVAPLADTVEILGCLGVALGLMSGTGEGLTENASSDLFWIAPRARLAFALSLGSLAPWLEIGAEVPLRRPDFTVEGLGTVYQPSPVIPFVALGLELRVPAEK